MLLICLAVAAGGMFAWDRHPPIGFDIPTPLPFWKPHFSLPDSLATQRDEAVAQIAAMKAAGRRRNIITARTETEAAKAQEIIRTVNRNIVREVPRYVTREADIGCTVTVGAVRVYNAAAQGIPLSGPSGITDDSPAPVGFAELIGATAENFGTYHTVADRLSRLQGWIKEQQSLQPQ